ncbi:MAG TPA: hypothetical protein VFZ23_10570 [Pyrinomonadaceae bacterium]
MPNSRSGLGQVVSVHGISPVYLQRAAVVAILSFFFFLTTLLVFYLQQRLLYFILSTSFLVVYIFTMIGWVMQKRNTVSIHENGVAYRKFVSTWGEIKSVKSDPGSGITITKLNGESATIGKSIEDHGVIAAAIARRLP